MSNKLHTRACASIREPNKLPGMCCWITAAGNRTFSAHFVVPFLSFHNRPSRQLWCHFPLTSNFILVSVGPATHSSGTDAKVKFFFSLMYGRMRAFKSGGNKMKMRKHLVVIRLTSAKHVICVGCGVRKSIYRHASIHAKILSNKNGTKIDGKWSRVGIDSLGLTRGDR